MRVSVIVPTHGSRDLSKLYRSIENSSVKVDDFHVINIGEERSTQRNIGIANSTADVILILDSDQYISRHLIAECKKLFDMGYSSIYIPEIITTKGWFGRLRNWERQFYTGTAVDCVRFVVKKYCPFFDTSMNGPEDSDFDRRVKGLKAISKNVLYHDDNIGVIDYFKKKAYYSKTMKAFEDKYPNDKILNIWWRCFVVYFEKGKWKRVALRPDLFVCLMLLIFIRGVIYYANK